MTRTTTPHLPAADLAAFVEGRRPLTREHQLDVAFHLAVGCEPCWKALDKMSAIGSHQPLVPHRKIPSSSLSPHWPEPWVLLRALRRVGAPRSWPALRCEHLEAIRRVRIETWGFARLLIDEADSLIDEEGQCDSERLLELPHRLVEALSAAEPACQVGADLRGRLELAHADGAFYEARERMAAALERATWYLRQGTGSPALTVELLLSKARRAFYEGDRSDRVSRCIARSLEILPGDARLHRLEVIDSAVRYQELDDFWRTGDTHHLRYALVKCLEAVRELGSDPDPVRRLSGLIRLAELGLTMRLVAEMRLGPRPDGIPALALLAAQLETHLPEFAAHADMPILSKVRRRIADLRAGGEPDHSSPDGPPDVAPAFATTRGSLLPHTRTATP